MKIKRFLTPLGGFKLKALGNRFYEVLEDCVIVACTDIGVFRHEVKAGFVTNFRSGGRFVDGFIDQIGDDVHQGIWLFHDCCYTPCSNKCGTHAVNRKTADDLLYELLVYAGESKVKAGIIWASVRMFGNSAYKDNDKYTEENINRLVSNGVNDNANTV